MVAASEKSNATRRILLIAEIAFLLLLSPWHEEADAEEFSMTNLQLLRGEPFYDTPYGTHTESGSMDTLTLEHFGAWKYGYNYFFIDLYHGEFVGSGISGQTVRSYAEWETQISLGKLTGRPRLNGIFKDVFLCAQLDRGGNGFYANLLGGGAYFDVGEKNLLTLGAYFRKDKYNTLTYQFTPFWYFPFFVSKLRFVFTGYADFIGTDTLGMDFNAQPQLLLDLGVLFGWSEESLLLGSEWFLHRNRSTSTSALQGLLKWVW
jgi:nucleoside-specific outer membrane channel protein Tsx